MIKIQSQQFDPEAELRAFRETNAQCGGLASFSGYVRDDGGDVEVLTLQHYPGLCEREIGNIVEAAKNRFDIADCLVVHRFGAMLPGEPIVLVAACASHRKPALEAVDFLMDFLKTSAPFWKQETRAAQKHWIEPTQNDYASTRSWSEKE